MAKEINMMLPFGDDLRPVRIAYMQPGSGGFELSIDNRYNGILHYSDLWGWRIYLNKGCPLYTADIGILMDLIKENFAGVFTFVNENYQCFK